MEEPSDRQAQPQGLAGVEPVWQASLVAAPDTQS